VSILDVLRPALRAGKRYGVPWVAGALVGKGVGSAAGGGIGYLSADEDASEQDRIARALIGAGLGFNFGGVAGGAIGAGPRIAADLTDVLRARTAANDMGVLERILAARQPTRASSPLGLPPVRRFNGNVSSRFAPDEFGVRGHPSAPFGQQANNNMSGWEEMISPASRGRPFSDDDVLFGMNSADELQVMRPAASDLAARRWGLPQEELPEGVMQAETLANHIDDFERLQGAPPPQGPRLELDHGWRITGGPPPTPYEQALMRQRFAGADEPPADLRWHFDDQWGGVMPDRGASNALTPEQIARLRAAGLIT
jgi:hypothetical protein